MRNIKNWITWDSNFPLNPKYLVKLAPAIRKLIPLMYSIHIYVLVD